jgi:hypothetical protein
MGLMLGIWINIYHIYEFVELSYHLEFNQILNLDICEFSELSDLLYLGPVDIELRHM